MAGKKKIRIFVVDTSVIYRDLIKRAFEEVDDIEIIGISPNGNLGLISLANKVPDQVLLDVNISDITPIQFVTKALEKINNLGIILTTDPLTELKNVEKTIIALEAGAIDFIGKPDVKDEEKSIEILKRKLLSKIRAFSIRHYSQIAKIATGRKTDNGAASTVEVISKELERANKYAHAKESPFRVIAIGVSTGGPEALAKIIPQLPVDFSVPILLVIHLPKSFTATLARELDKKSKVKVVEAKEGTELKKGTVYLSEGGRHLTIEKSHTHNTYMVGYSDEPAENGCKPSVDVLFRSVANTFKEKAIGLILTGMGEDGVKGIGLMKKNGALTLAQDEESSVIWGMPGTAVYSGAIDHVFPLDEIAKILVKLTK